jgi:hypothetical protein
MLNASDSPMKIQDKNYGSRIVEIIYMTSQPQNP